MELVVKPYLNCIKSENGCLMLLLMHEESTEAGYWLWNGGLEFLVFLFSIFLVVLAFGIGVFGWE